eukprot:scaffold5977_cov103-Isochrysis_galbana.AAC.1
MHRGGAGCRGRLRLLLFWALLWVLFWALLRPAAPDGQVFHRVPPARQRQPQLHLPAVGQGLLEGGRSGISEPFAHMHQHRAPEAEQALCRHGRARGGVAQEKRVTVEPLRSERSRRPERHGAPRRVEPVERVACLRRPPPARADCSGGVGFVFGFGLAHGGWGAVVAVHCDPPSSEQLGPVAHPSPHLHHWHPQLRDGVQRLLRRHRKCKHPARPLPLGAAPFPDQGRGGRFLVTRRAPAGAILGVGGLASRARSVEQLCGLGQPQPPQGQKRVGPGRRPSPLGIEASQGRGGLLQPPAGRQRARGAKDVRHCCGAKRGRVRRAQEAGGVEQHEPGRAAPGDAGRYSQPVGERLVGRVRQL